MIAPPTALDGFEHQHGGAIKLPDQENALLCDPDDIGAWVSAIERLRLDDQLRAALARRASEDFALLHTWEKRVQRILRPLLARDDGVTADS
jgi:glycosyltransferase involved in cell wall biosynthesis